MHAKTGNGSYESMPKLVLEKLVKSLKWTNYRQVLAIWNHCASGRSAHYVRATTHFVLSCTPHPILLHLKRCKAIMGSLGEFLDCVLKVVYFQNAPSCLRSIFMSILIWSMDPRPFLVPQKFGGQEIWSHKKFRLPNKKNWSTVHPGQDWFIIHVKLGHSMDNGFIFKKINKN